MRTVQTGHVVEDEGGWKKIVEEKGAEGGGEEEIFRIRIHEVLLSEGREVTV